MARCPHTMKAAGDDGVTYCCDCGKTFMPRPKSDPWSVYKNGSLIKEGFSSEYHARSWGHRWIGNGYEVRQ